MKSAKKFTSVVLLVLTSAALVLGSACDSSRVRELEATAERGKVMEETYKTIIQNREGEVAARDRAIEERNATIESGQKKIAELEKQLSAVRREVATLNEQLESCDCGDE